MLTAMDRKAPNTYSYTDYLEWPEDKRIELIDGVPFRTTTSPSRLHQQIVLEPGRQFANFLKGKTCEVNIAPFDVRLSDKADAKDDEVFTVVQPDLVVVCNESKLDERGCNGAPDLIIEVISPSNAAHDYIRKMDLYEKSGVKEYWIVHPVDQIVRDGGTGSLSRYFRRGTRRCKVAVISSDSSSSSPVTKITKQAVQKRTSARLVF